MSAPIMLTVDQQEQMRVVQDLEAAFRQRLAALPVTPPAEGWDAVAHALAHDAYDSLRGRRAEWVMATTDYHRIHGAPGA